MANKIEEGQVYGSINYISIKETEIILKQMKMSICKIFGKKMGTGFFCNVNGIPCLMTNHHILDDKFINDNKKIKISMNDKTINDKLTIDKKDILYISDNNHYDLIIIKMNQKFDYINYLELDDNLDNKNSEIEYEEESIYILHYPYSDKNKSSYASVSYGYGIETIDNNNYDIMHKCNTQNGSSGGPILNLATKKVIGIHKAFIQSEGINKGSLLKEPLKSLKSDNNYIIGEIRINSYEINKDILIINSFENAKRKRKWEDSKDEWKYENEKEIKENIEIKINDKPIKCSYYYKFEKEGNYIIKYSFKNNLNKTCYMFSYCDSLINLDFSNFNTENVNNMSYMFAFCNSLTNINLSNFNTKNVTDMSYMFNCCIKLTNINL